MKNIVILILLPVLCFSQKKYSKNKHVIINTEVYNNSYNINYVFKNQWNEIQELRFNLNKEKSDFDIRKFGIPDNMFEVCLESFGTQRTLRDHLRTFWEHLEAIFRTLKKMC